MLILKIILGLFEFFGLIYTMVRFYMLNKKHKQNEDRIQKLEKEVHGLIYDDEDPDEFFEWMLEYEREMREDKNGE